MKFTTLAYIFYNKSLAQGHFHLVHAHGTHKHPICQKSTNSPLSCVIFQDGCTFACHLCKMD